MITDSFKKIHVKMNEKERSQIFKEFKNGGCVLITSDLFARGIDVQ